MKNLIEAKTTVGEDTISPKVTVGIMAYNEEKYLSQAIESILKQLDFSDYEILISDNASEDKTGQIAQEYADKHKNIRYVRHPQNLGALNNFNSLVKNAQGKYFVLAGAHDLWSPNFLFSLVQALDLDPQAVIAYAPTIWIDEDGKHLNKPTGFIDTSGSNVVERFNMVMWGNQHAMYGLYRLDALRRTRLQLSIIGSGAVMLGELAIEGTFIVFPEATWYRRMNRQPETRQKRLQRYSQVLFSKPRRLILPHWQIPIAYFTGVLRSKTSLPTRLLLIMSATTSLIRYGPAMLLDLLSIVNFNK